MPSIPKTGEPFENLLKLLSVVIYNAEEKPEILDKLVSFDGVIVNLTLSANHPVHPCAPAKRSAHAYTQNCARIHRYSPNDTHARVQQRTHIYNYS